MPIILLKMLYGSRLYGTHTPESATDYKVVYLPDLDGLLLGQGTLSQKTINTRPSGATRNTAGDTDVGLVPLQVLLSDYYKGQAYAVEMVHGAFGQEAEQFVHPWMEVLLTELVEQFPCRKVSPLVGFALAQHTRYAKRGDHYYAYLHVQDVLKSLPNPQAKLGSPEVQGALQLTLNTYPDKLHRSTYDDGRQQSPCFVLSGATLPYSSSVQTALLHVESRLKTYRGRVKDAFKHKASVDWKSLAHAVRAVMQAEELLSTQRLVFPMSPVDTSYIGRVRAGELPLQEVLAEVERRLGLVREMEAALPEINEDESRLRYNAWCANWIRRSYRILQERSYRDALSAAMDAAIEHFGPGNLAKALLSEWGAESSV